MARRLTQDWIMDHRAYQGDGCLIWPFACNWDGYGRASENSKTWNAHRLMCIKAHGEPPSAGHHAAHTCGVHSCVNPKHLYWASPAENQRDITKHRSHRPNGAHPTLTPGKVRFIREMLAEGVSQRALANEFGVSTRCIRLVQNNQTWFRS